MPQTAMPQTATIRSLPQAFEVIKQMEADGCEWGEDYRAAGRDALADIIARDVGFGSTAVLRRDREEGPLLEEKQTKSGAKRTMTLEGRLSGVKQTKLPRNRTLTSERRVSAAKPSSSKAGSFYWCAGIDCLAYF